MNNTYKIITEKILAALETGVKPWVKPWKNGAVDQTMPHNALSGYQYKGVNIILCWLSAMQHGFSHNGWITAGQCIENGWSFKGQKATQILIFKRVDKKNEDGSRDPDNSYAFAKTHNVFNIEQIRDIDPSYLNYVEDERNFETVPERAAIDLGITFREGGNQACYIPSMDLIKLPPFDSFKSHADYESTFWHEIVHGTSHKDRCNRKLGNYALEELVAELGAAFLGARLGLPYGELQHESYIASWIKALKDDDTAFQRAAKMAEDACEYILERVVISPIQEAA